MLIWKQAASNSYQADTGDHILRVTPIPSGWTWQVLNQTTGNVLDEGTTDASRLDAQWLTEQALIKAKDPKKQGGTRRWVS